MDLFLNILAAALALLLLVGVPAAVVYAFRHHRRRDADCRRVALRHGFEYRSGTDELCDPELEILEQFQACREDVATRPEFRYVFTRSTKGGESHAFDYYHRGTPGAEAPVFHGTWLTARRDGLSLPLFVVGPKSLFASAFERPELPADYAVRSGEGRAGGVSDLLPDLGEWLRNEAEAGRRWTIEGGGPWVAVRKESGASVRVHRPVDAEEIPIFFREAWAAVTAVERAWQKVLP